MTFQSTPRSLSDQPASAISAAPISVTIVANNVGGVGGMELQLAELVRGLVAAGDQVTVIARTFDVPDVDVTFHRVPGPARPFVVGYPLFALLATAMLRRHRRGVVQITGAIVLNHVDVVAVHYCHAAADHGSASARASRESPLFQLHARLARVLARVGERICFTPRRIGTAVAVSPGVAAELTAHYPRLADRIAVIPNGVDRVRFAPAADDEQQICRQQFDLPTGEPCAVFVGGDWGRKGLDVAIRALQHAAGWHLAVAGSGDVAAYTRLAASVGVASRVHFLGVVDEMPNLYRAASAFVLPTSYESFSLVAYEAAASGLPLLATGVSGVEDIVVEGITGFRIRPDAEEIGLRLQELAADLDAADRLGAAARDHTGAYTWSAMVARHRALYRARLSAVAVGVAEIGSAGTDT